MVLFILPGENWHVIEMIFFIIYALYVSLSSSTIVQIENKKPILKKIVIFVIPTIIAQIIVEITY